LVSRLTSFPEDASLFCGTPLPTLLQSVIKKGKISKKIPFFRAKKIYPEKNK